MRTLTEALRSWDGKSSSYLEDLFKALKAEGALPATLLDVAMAPEFERAATWLLKHGLEAGVTLSKAETTQFLNLFPQLDHWEARLHALQCLPQMTIPETQALSLKTFLSDAMSDKKTFVRAWAYGGALTLARQHSEFTDWAQGACADAFRSESASVKARLRQLGFSDQSGTGS